METFSPVRSLIGSATTSACSVPGAHLGSGRPWEVARPASARHRRYSPQGSSDRPATETGTRVQWRELVGGPLTPGPCGSGGCPRPRSAPVARAPSRTSSVQSLCNDPDQGRPRRFGLRVAAPASEGLPVADPGGEGGHAGAQRAGMWRSISNVCPACGRPRGVRVPRWLWAVAFELGGLNPRRASQCPWRGFRAQRPPAAGDLLPCRPLQLVLQAPLGRTAALPAAVRTVGPATL